MAQLQLQVQGPTTLLPDTNSVFCVWLTYYGHWPWWPAKNSQIIVEVIEGGTIVDSLSSVERGSFDVGVYIPNPNGPFVWFLNNELPHNQARVGALTIKTAASGQLTLQFTVYDNGTPLPPQYYQYNIIGTVGDQWDYLEESARSRARLTEYYKTLYLDFLERRNQSIQATTLNAELINRAEQNKLCLKAVDLLFAGMSDIAAWRAPWDIVAEESYGQLKGTVGIPSFYSFLFDFVMNLFDQINRYQLYGIIYGMPTLADPFIEGNPGSLADLKRYQLEEADAWKTKIPQDAFNALANQKDPLDDSQLATSYYTSKAQYNDHEGAAGLFRAMNLYVTQENQNIPKLQQIAKNLRAPEPQKLSRSPEGSSVSIGQGNKFTFTFQIKNNGGIVRSGFFSFSVSQNLSVTSCSCSKGTTPEYY